MLLVVGSGLLVIEDGAFRDVSMLGVQFSRFGGYRRKRDLLLVLEERIHALVDQIDGALPLRRVNLLLKPYRGITLRNCLKKACTAFFPYRAENVHESKRLFRIFRASGGHLKNHFQQICC